MNHNYFKRNSVSFAHPSTDKFRTKECKKRECENILDKLICIFLLRYFKGNHKKETHRDNFLAIALN